MNKRYKKGSLGFGIYGIIFSIVFAGIASTMFMNFDGLLVLFVIPFYTVAIFLLVVSIKSLINGIKSNEVKKLGRTSTGIVKELRTIHHGRTSTSTSSTTYNVVVEYREDFGNTRELEESLPRKYFDLLSDNKIVDIILYKERAILDRSKLNN